MEPAVQASYMKNVLAALERSGHAAALAARAPALVEAIEAVPRMRWLPVAHNVRLVESIVACYGETRGLALLAECVFAQFDSTLWRGFVRSALRLLGREPSDLGRWIPHALSLVFRGCGVWSASPDRETALRVEVHELPAALVEERLWLRSLAIGMTPLFMLCERPGTACLEAVDPAARSARYRLAWKAGD